MLRPNDIVTQLQDCLPLLTDRFHDEIPITSAIVSSGNLVITFPEDHGLFAGEKIYIDQALIRNRLVSAAVTVDDTVRYETENEHDLTAYMEERPGRQWPNGKTVLLELPTPEIVQVTLDPTSAGVPSSFLFEGVDGSPIPTITGNEYLLENRAYGVSGFKTIDSVTPNTITIDLSDVPNVPDGAVIMEHILTNVRVCTVADLDRAKEIYTKQASKAYMFVIMLDRDASNGRSNDDDFTSLPGSSYRPTDIIQNFSVLVMVPCNDDLGANENKEWVYSDLFVILNQCLYGWEKTGYKSDGQAEYNTAYYAHAFDFEARSRIDFEDGYINNKTVAFRDLEWAQTIFDEGNSDASIEL